MQSIERYGVVALLFLIVTVAAVLMWGSGEEPKPERRSVAQTSLTTGEEDAPRTSARAGALTDAARAEREARLQRRDELPGDRYADSSGSGRRDRLDETTRSHGGIVPGGMGDARPVGDVGPERPAGETLAAGTQVEDDFDAEAERRRRLEREKERRLERERLEREAEEEEARLAEARLAEERERARAARSADKPRSGVPVYVVAKNEVLGKIAQRELGTVKRMKEIIDLNPGLNPDRIKEGMKLRMPNDWSGKGAVAVLDDPKPASRPEEVTPPAGARAYVVKQNESLWRIAENQLGSGPRYREIEALNPGIEGRSIQPGQTIFLPGTEVALANPRSDGGRSTRTRGESSSTKKGRVR